MLCRNLDWKLLGKASLGLRNIRHVEMRIQSRVSEVYKLQIDPKKNSSKVFPRPEKIWFRKIPY